MSAVWLDSGDRPAFRLVRASLADGRDEKWLQALLFAHPELIPLDRIALGAERLIPICREFSLPKPTGSVFLDILGVTPHGRLVLVECKLWRNPQARREVVAQILEYAALLRRWSYADLTARLKSTLKWEGPNPLYDRVRDRLATPDEARFVDAVSRSLKSGDFELIIAGDGIREDLSAIADHLGAQGARLALVEFQLWSDPQGGTLVIPTLPLRTEVIRHRVIVDGEGVPLRIEETPEAADIAETVIDPDQAAARARNRAFWQHFIDTVRFDHPDQPPPRHGGNNWVRISLPAPAHWLTAYRSTKDAGLLLTLSGEDAEAHFDDLAASADALRQETGLDLVFQRKPGLPFSGTIGVARPLTGFVNTDAQSAWLAEAANRLVNALRPWPVGNAEKA